MSNNKTPINVKQNNIYNIYKWPNNQYSVTLKNNKETIFITFKNPSQELKKIANNYFYQEFNTKKKKRQTYHNLIKQIAVDLYLNLHLSYKEIGNYLHINPENIKKWASLTKYHRKISLIEYLMIKFIIHKYKKITKKRGDNL